MAILKPKASEELRRTPNPQGPDVVVDFSYTSDSLAQMIVDAWVDEDFRKKLLKKENAKSLLAARGFYLENPIVISEDDYRKNYTQDDDNEVVLVAESAARDATDSPRPVSPRNGQAADGGYAERDLMLPRLDLRQGSVS